MSANGFDTLKATIEELKAICLEVLTVGEISAVSLADPTPPINESYFKDTILWCYVFFRETGRIIPYSRKLLRVHNTQAHERFQQLVKVIDAARTTYVHNLTEDSPSDQKIKRDFEIWILSNCHIERDWSVLSTAVIADATIVISKIEKTWRRLSENMIDRKNLRHDYEQEKLTSWEAHKFDSIVNDIAEELSLVEFDSTKFRKEGSRLERWRKLASCFGSRAAAEVAIKRVIRQEIFNLFGAAEL